MTGPADKERAREPEPARRVRTKTYSIGLYLVIIVILIQILAVLSIFWFRRIIKIDVQAPTLTNAAHVPGPDSPTIVIPLTSAPIPEPAFKTTPGLIAPPDSLQPDFNNARVPARLSMRQLLNPTERVSALNQEADKFIKQGDMDLAKAALLEAENLDPQNPLTLINQARIFENESNWEQALGYWQRVKALGEKASDNLAIADQRIQFLTETIGSEKKSAATSLLSTQGFNFSLVSDNDKAYEFVLKIPITRNDSTTKIDPNDVSIQLFFYDELNGGAIVPTDAKREVGFENEKASWTTNKTETLRAHYVRVRTPIAQKYYGYLFRLYYQGKLLEESSSPARLLGLLPARKAAAAP